jgi:hypothetical protein
MGTRSNVAPAQSALEKLAGEGDKSVPAVPPATQPQIPSVPAAPAEAPVPTPVPTPAPAPAKQ